MDKDNLMICRRLDDILKILAQIRGTVTETLKVVDAMGTEKIKEKYEKPGAG